ncbi:MAG: cytochrome C oxidase subunit IV family protein [Ilumatobacteraceae bacterium]|jgi:cytochrome c oxidase subunit 4|nr:cytochrome C oxidase subunit IV family protein [Ilumatobacteraceae bacterium]
MSTSTEQHEHGMTDAGYIKIAIILAAITALEVSTYYVDFGPLFMPSLMIMMVVKFVMVVSYFMHLKFDSKIFTFLFYTGLGLALFVYITALATFKFFIS